MSSYDICRLFFPDEEKLIKNSDSSQVIVRPKYYVGSTGCVWASDMLRLRYEQPDIYEMTGTNESKSYSKQERAFCAKVRDNIFYYLDSTTEDDLASLQKGQNQFVLYEIERLSHFQKRLNLAMEDWKDTENVKVAEKISEILTYINTVLEHLQSDDMDQTLVSLNFLTEQCQHVMQTIDLLCLPEVKPIICEYTDAGPGVGISNTAV